MKIIKELIEFIISFSFVLFIVTFLLKIPQNITNNPKLVNEYYFKNFKTSVPLDFILVYIYLQIAFLFNYILNIDKFEYKLLSVAFITMILTGGFCYYYLSIKKTNNFFSRWFHSVKYKSIIYDVILLTFTYACMNYIKRMVDL